MKSVKFFLFLVLLFAFSSSAEAQFLNRLKEKVIESAENVIIDKTAEKAAESAENAMESLLNPNVEGLFNLGGEAIDKSELPDSYIFNYLYNLKMTTDGGEIEMQYLFNKSEPYFGARTEMAPDMLMIYDDSKDAVIIKSGDLVMARKMPGSDSGTDTDLESLYSNYTFTELPSRVFLGYTCSGYQLENDEHRLTIYVAPNLGVSFNNTGGEGIPNMSPEMKSFAKKYEDGLMMYMEMEDKLNKGKKNNSSATMECIGFEESNIEVGIN